MNDFLETPVGDFDWGPRKRVAGDTPRTTTHIALIVLGVLALTLGIMIA